MSTLDITKKTPSELIKGFEGDIVFDCHGYTARFERSQYRQELQRRGRTMLQSITDHLRANPPGGGRQLDTAWGHLLNWIEIDIDPEKSGPRLLKDLSGWIAWADRMACA